MSLEREFIPYEQALALKELGFDEGCFSLYFNNGEFSNFIHSFTVNSEVVEKTSSIPAPTFSQVINFLYICSNKQIDIELKGSDTYEERIRKIEKGCKDLWNLQNNKSN